MTGWFADIDSDQEPPFQWQPCLDMDSGMIPSLQVWFKTREECESFIRDEVIPHAGKFAD